MDLQKVLKVVERGGQVVLLRDGSPVARIAPLTEITPDLMTPEERKEAWERFFEAVKEMKPLNLTREEVVATIRRMRDS